MNSRIPTHIARYLQGLMYFVFGLNGFLHFLPEQPPPPPAALAFAGALMGSGYLFALLKGTEVLAGVLLLGNRYVPLALTLLAPIVVNIVAFHAFLAPSGMPIALLTLALELFLAYQYREAFLPMLRARTAPSAETASAPASRAHSATA